MKCLKFILPAVLVALIAVFALTGCTGNGNGNGDVTYHGNVGAGAISFTFEMTDADGDINRWSVRTEEGMNLGDVLIANNLIEGDDGQWGLLVSHVFGIRADWSLDNAFWGFYVDGAFSPVGVSDVFPEDGAVYAFVFTPA